MKSLAGFIHAGENARVLRRISDRGRISKSENLHQNPGFRRSGGGLRPLQFLSDSSNGRSIGSKKKSLPMRCMGGF